MLKSTFCHLPGTGSTSEKKLWDLGIKTWEDLIEADKGVQRISRCSDCGRLIEESFKHLNGGNPSYFADRLSASQCWRLFSKFRDVTAYLDIETTGLYRGDSITTAVLYDGNEIFHFVKGDNLPQLKRKIKDYKLIVTYNGKCFDIPFIEQYFDISLNCAQIDLRYVLSGLGIKGGLKGCERKLKIQRPAGMKELDGFFAVLLWSDYKKSENLKALETLLAYNVQDAIDLERLLVIAYNRNLRKTPLDRTGILEEPSVPRNPFKVDGKTVRKIQRNTDWDSVW
jgi:uncharacterized protein